MFKAVVLAAGRRESIKGLTAGKPKAMNKLRGKPLLAHVLDRLVGRVSLAVVVVGFKKELIIDYFNNSYKGLALKYVVLDEQLGTAHALRAVSGLINESFILVYGDLYFDSSVIDQLLRNPCAGVMAVKEVTNPHDCCVVELDSGRVKRILDNCHDPPTDLANAGIYLMPREIFDAVKKIKLSVRDKYGLTDVIQLLINKGFYFGIAKIND